MKSVITYSLFLLATLVFLILIKAFNISYPLEITNKTTSGELSVVGEGKVDVIPNKATVDAGISVANASTIEEVRGKIDATHNAIVVVMSKLGIKKEEIKTSNYSINPNYNYDGSQKITGYNGNASLTITIKDTAKLSDVVSSATAAGANTVSSPNYSVDSVEKYREQAREKAIANAKEQAQKLSQNLGIRLGRITNIVESTPDSRVYALPVMNGLGGSVEKADFQPGSQTITSTVTLYFEKQ